MPKLCSLPPTDPAFMEKLKRAHFQICIWKHALDLNVPGLDPIQYGWTKDKATKSLAAVYVPPNTDLALSYIQELIKCSCSSDPPCVTSDCGCKKAGMPCSVFCACKITIVTEHKHMEMMITMEVMMKMMMTTKLHI